jgi:hypothetical protein
MDFRIKPYDFHDDAAEWRNGHAVRVEQLERQWRHIAYGVADERHDLHGKLHNAVPSDDECRNWRNCESGERLLQQRPECPDSGDGDQRELYWLDGDRDGILHGKFESGECHDECTDYGKCEFRTDCAGDGADEPVGAVVHGRRLDIHICSDVPMDFGIKPYDCHDDAAERRNGHAVRVEQLERQWRHIAYGVADK